MEQLDRQQRARELAARLGDLPPDEVGRLTLGLLVGTVVSLVLQAVLAVMVVLRVRQAYAARRGHPRRRAFGATNAPLLVVAAVAVGYDVASTLWRARWLRRLTGTGRGDGPGPHRR